MAKGGKAAGRLAEGFIGKAVRNLLRTTERGAGRRGARAAARRGARGAGRNAGRARSRLFGRRTLGGDPIDLVTGEVVVSETDLDLPGRLPLVVTRTYVSSYHQGRLHGAAWSSSLEQRLEVDGAGITYVAEDGMVLEYEPPVNGSIVQPEEGPRRALSTEPDGGYTITDRAAGQTLRFAPRDPRLGPVRPLVSITDRNGARIEFDYDDAGALSRVRHSGGYRLDVVTDDGLLSELRLTDGTSEPVTVLRYGYDTDRRLTEVTNSSGRPMRYHYDEDGLLAGWTDRNGVSYSYGYDEDGRCVRASGTGGYLAASVDYDTERRVTVVTDSLGHPTEFHFNEALQVVREVDPLGAEVHYEWDRYDRMLARTDQLGHTTRYRYDTAGDLVAVSHPNGTRASARYNAYGLPVTIVHTDGSVWQHEYDTRGNLTAVIDPTGAAQRFGYDERGHLATVTNELGQVRRIQTNGQGQVIAVTDPTGATTRTDRDLFGRVTSVTDPLGNTTRYGWTVEGAMAWHQRPDGTTERWSYDPEGNLVSHVDLAGQVTRIEPGGFDVPVAQIGPDGARYEMEYDTELRMTSLTDPRGLEWRYEYDAAGRLVAEIDVNGRVRRYDCDAAGQLVAVTSGDQRIEYTRDAMGDVVAERVGDEVTTFAYDGLGRLRQARNPDAELTFSYDQVGNRVAEVCNGREVMSGFDPTGRRAYRRTPSGAESVWSFDAADRPVALVSGGQTMRFGYDAAGREVHRGVGAASLSRVWDENSQLRALTLTAGPGPGLRRRYSYRPDGRPLSVDDPVAGPRRYDHDSTGRVTGVRGAGWTERYGYDRAGNPEFASWPAPVPPNADPRGPREYTGSLVRRAGNIRYEYDRLGRVVLRQHQRLSDRRTWHYTWDARDQLVEVRTPDGQRWRYLYDPLGRRIAKQRLAADGMVTEQVDFVWDGYLLAERTQAGWRPDGLVSHTTVWDFEPDTFRPVSQTERGSAANAPQSWVDERFYAIVTDLTGAPTDLVDPGGALAWHHDASLWGASVNRPAGPVDCPLRFPGQYFDTESQLSYNVHRYYDPLTARYQSPDPIGLRGGPNPHAYVSDPVTLMDPLGLVPVLSYRTQGKYTARSRRHIWNQKHAANRPQTPGKGRFRPTEGGQKFTDEVINHPNTRVTTQHDGRIRYDAPDLGRQTGRDRHGNPARGGRVVIEGPTPVNPHNGPNDVVTQFPQQPI